MPLSAPSTASQLLQALGAALLLTAFWMRAARRLAGYTNAYAVQSVAIALVAAVVGAFTGNVDLYAVAGLTVLVKVIAITGILRTIARRLPVQREVRPTLNLPTSLLVGVALVLLAFLASPAVVAPGTFLNEPPLAVSLALVLIGLFVISSRRHALGVVSNATILAHAEPASRTGLLARLAGWAAPPSPMHHEPLIAALLMEREVVTIPEEASIAEAARQFLAHRIRRLIVVDAHGRLAGLIDRRALCRSLAGLAEHANEPMEI